MSYELVGKLVAKFDVVQRTETFKTREFVIEKSEDINGRTITNYVKFQCVQDRTSLPDRFNIGETVKVLFNIKGTKWEKNGQVNYITNLDAWRIETVQMATPAAPHTDREPDYSSAPNTGSPDMIDDLPF